MTHSDRFDCMHPPSPEAGYTIVEMLIALVVLMIVSASVFEGIQRLTDVSDTVHNRAEMHAGVRNATELLQQEIGQAGRVALPQEIRLQAAVVANPAAEQPVLVDTINGLFVGEKVVVDAGANRETVAITAINNIGPTISGVFRNNHAAAAPVVVKGGFSSGVVPTTTLNGSTPTVLKIFGDINADGNMVYVEYVCDTVAGNLYRNSMPYTTGAKAAPTVAQVLLSNVLPNPGGTPCFTYQQETVSGTTFVIDVAITLTVQTERPDPVTGLFQTETKALLNVSPRNVFQVWQMATLNVNDRVQPTPASVTALLP